MAASFATLPTASVIRQAADKLKKGDILLLEIHRAGPDTSGVGQDGYIAIEWWPDDLAAIRYAVAEGSSLWRQPAMALGISTRRSTTSRAQASRPHGATRSTLRTRPRAAICSTGAPPPGTHGRDHGPDRSRLAFSNYGRRVDAQGWGRE